MFIFGAGMRSSILLTNSTLEISARFLLSEVAVILMVTFFTAICPPKSTTMEPSGCTVAPLAENSANSAGASAVAGASTVNSCVFPSSSSTRMVAPVTEAGCSGGRVCKTRPPISTDSLSDWVNSKSIRTGFSSEISPSPFASSLTEPPPASRASRSPAVTSVPSTGCAEIISSGMLVLTVDWTSPASSRLAASICRSTRSTMPLPSRSPVPSPSI